MRNLISQGPPVKRLARSSKEQGMAYDPVTGATVAPETPELELARCERQCAYYERGQAKRRDLRAQGFTVAVDPALERLAYEAQRAVAAARLKVAVARRLARPARRPVGTRPGLSLPTRARRRARRPKTRISARTGPPADGPPPPSCADFCVPRGRS